MVVHVVIFFSISISSFFLVSLLCVFFLPLSFIIIIDLPLSFIFIIFRIVSSNRSYIVKLQQDKVSWKFVEVQ